MMNFSIFKVAFRNAKRNSVLTFAKLFGLSISFAIILFSAGYVYYETSFDKCIPDYKKIYRCIMQGKLNGSDANFAVTSPEMAKAIVNDIPEVNSAIRLIVRGGATLKYNNESIEAGLLLLADPEFFSFFGIPIQKEQQNPFQSENNIAIAKSLAIKYFGSAEKALNKVVILRGDNCVITGVFDDLPDNFHLQSKVIQSIKKTNPEKVGWDSQSYYTYLKTTSEIIDRDVLNFKLTKSAYSHWNAGVDGAKAQTWSDLKNSDESYLIFTAEPLADIHFSSHRFDPAVKGSLMYVYGISIFTLLILLISSINFINLSIANFSTRFKEIGIRKANGAFSKQIASQLITESIIFWIIGFCLALIIYLIAGKPFGHYLNFNINISNTVLFTIAISTFLVLLAFNLAMNLIPIIYFSKRKALTLIQEKTPEVKRFSLKDSFVFLQFVLSSLIILSSLFVQKQINFMVNKDRGYDTENIIMLSMWSVTSEQRKTFIDEIKLNTAIKSVSTSDVYFGDDPSMSGAYFEIQDDANYFHPSILPVDDEFLSTFNLKMLEGRFFEKDRKSDFNTVILNESAVKEYHGKGSLIGKTLIANGISYNIIGIVKDFNYRSLYYRIQPLVFKRIENYGNINIKIRNNQISEALLLLKNEWEKLEISSPFSYEFHDEVLANQYKKDKQARTLLLILSLISISIACIGLYAISFFTILSKTKEIGIRKVNGAKISEIMRMLNRNFLIWVASAFIVAAPIAYLAMQKWLENFAYKTELSWWIFALAGLMALGIALLTVSWQSWKAATRNPVEALRYE